MVVVVLGGEGWGLRGCMLITYDTVYNQIRLRPKCSGTEVRWPYYTVVTRNTTQCARARLGPV